MKKLTGKEARYILKSNRINLADLAQKLGIMPQSLNSRLNVDEFSVSRQLEINAALGENIFPIDNSMQPDKIPVLDITASAGFGIGQYGEEKKVIEYVSIPSLKGCVGITVYGDSMKPNYNAGDVIFVKPITETNVIEYGHTYLIITHDDRLLKNIYPSKHDATCFRLSSFNDDTNRQGDRLFPDFDIPKESVIYLYKVVGSLRREQI